MSQPASLDHDQLVQLVYDSADTPEGFVDFLPHLGRIVGAERGQVLVIDTETGHTDNHSYGYDTATFDRYHLDWADQDPRFGAALRRPGRAMSDVEAIDWATFRRSAIYNEYLMPTGTYHTVFAVTDAGPSLRVAPAFMRGRQASPFDPKDADWLTSFLPHLARAARLRHLTAALHDARDDLRHALDASPSPLALLDGRGHVVAANTLLESLLRTDTLRTEHGVLTCARPDETRALTAAIDQTARLADAGSRPGAAAPPATATVSRPDSAPLTVVLSPLRPLSALRERGAGSARVLAIVHDPERRVRLRHDLVVRLHGLTATEAHVAVALAEGQSLDEIATARGISAQTARTHMKRILDKTGAGRQAELVRVLLTGLAAHQLR